MKKSVSKRYSDSELLKFKKIILKKIDTAKHDLQLLREILIVTLLLTELMILTLLLNLLKRALKHCLRSQTLFWLLDKKNLSETSKML